MNKILIIFKSKNSLMAFSKILRNNRLNVSIINTPHSIMTSCSQSILTDYKNYNLVLILLEQANLPGFLGIYQFANYTGADMINRIF